MRKTSLVLMVTLLFLASILPRTAAAREDGGFFFGSVHSAGEGNPEAYLRAAEDAGLDFCLVTGQAAGEIPDKRLLGILTEQEVVPILPETGGDWTADYIAALEAGNIAIPQGKYTVIPAETLTQVTLLENLTGGHFYITEDWDLELQFTLNGHPMGTQLERRQAGDRVTIRGSFHDPTGSDGTTLEVVTDGGTVIAGCSVGSGAGAVSFTLDAGCAYYFLRLTQSDGDRAVTAPVWIDQTEGAGIASFTADTDQPIQNRETELVLTLYNEEAEPLHITQITVSLEGEAVHSGGEDLWIGPGERVPYTFSLRHPHPGQAEIRAAVTAALGEHPRNYEASLTLTFRPAEAAKGIYIDAAHGNAGLDSLGNFAALAESCGQTVTLVEGWEGMEPNGAILIVTAPAVPFSGEFLEFAARFLSWGGSLVVCGQGDSLDGSLHSSHELNRLLLAVGSEMRLADDTLRDLVENTGQETDVLLTSYNTESHWYAPALKNRVLRLTMGCTVEGGTWLVKGGKWAFSRDGDGDGGEGGTVALAWQQAGGGGDILVCGGLLLADDLLAQPQNLWKEPYANRTFAEKLLGNTREQLTLTAIGKVRQGEEGRTYRIRGYITAGNSNASTTFPGVLYVQDDTGGIAVTGVTDTLQIGTPVEIEGILNLDGNDPVLEAAELTVLKDVWHRWQPITGGYRLVMDNSINGGRLVQLEGEVVSVTLQGERLTEFLLTDGNGRYATVSIGSNIRSGSTGKNELARTVRTGREVRAVGILYLREDGIAALRVRDCDEITLLADWPYADNAYADPTNPPTGDSIGWAVLIMLLSTAALTILKRRKG